MIDTNEVYRKIKEMSKRTPNPRSQIMIYNLASELLALKEQIMPSLVELKRLRLIQIDDSGSMYVKLTLLGFTVTR